MRRLIFGAFILIATMAFTVNGQTRPQATAPRPTPTPLPRPAATPLPRPAATPAAINAPVPESRIALIDTTMFGDEKNGILRYRDAAQSLPVEVTPATDEMQQLEKR